MTETPWWTQLNDSLQRSLDALQSHNYATAVYETNQVLPRLCEIEKQFITIRAEAYERQGKFDEALDDARRLSKSLPSFTPVVCVPRIFYKTNNLSETVETCDAIMNQRHHYPREIVESLNQLRATACQKLQRRTDGIRKLPLEMVKLILNELTFDDITNCINVSKTWRRRIFNCLPSTTTNHWDPGRQIDQLQNVSASYPPIHLLSNHITSLNLYYNLCDNEKRMFLQDIIEHLPFRRLRSIDAGYDCISKQSILALLQKTKSSLKKFSFRNTHFRNTDEGITLDQVLRNCPHLESLHFAIQPQGPIMYNARHSMHSLTDLYICTISILSEDFKHMLQDAPNLQNVSIGGCDDGHFLSVLHENGSSERLQHIQLVSDYINTGDTSYMDYERAVDVQFLEDFTADMLLLVLNKFNRIDALSIAFNPEWSNLDDWSAFSQFHSTYLRSMQLSSTPEGESIFAAAIRQCPALETIEMRNWSLPTCIIYNALQSLSSLRCFIIHIDNDEFMEDHDPMNDQDLRAFFNFHASLGKHSPLQQVHLRFVTGLSLATFQELFTIRTLKCIEIRGDLILQEEEMDKVISLLALSEQRLPMLEQVTLKELENLTDESIKYLDCESVQMNYCTGLTTSGIIDFINNSKKLKNLEIRGCIDVHSHVVQDYLTKRIPTIDFTSH